MNEHASLLPPFVPTRKSVRVVGILFMISAGISWVAVGYDFSEIRLALMHPENTTVSPATRLAFDAVGNLVGWAQLVSLAITAVAFLTWLHRVRVNMQRLIHKRNGRLQMMSRIAFMKCRGFLACLADAGRIICADFVGARA